MQREIRVHSTPTQSEKIRTNVEIVAIVAAGLWALYTFVYEQRIKPLSEAASFSVPTVVDQDAIVNGVVFLTIHKRVQNTGNVGIDVAAESLNVYGERIVPQPQSPVRLETSTHAEVSEDVPRKPEKLLYSMAKLREGTVGGGATNFFLAAHSSAEEDFLVAVPAKLYPVVLIERKDYIAKVPIVPKMAIRIGRTRLGAYALRSRAIEGEYDSEVEYPIHP